MELGFALTRLGGLDVALCLHTAEPVPQGEWDALIAELRAVGCARMLVVTDGGAPDARQRSQLGSLPFGKTILTAVLVPGMSNPIKRGLMTALSWFNPRMAFFAPTQLLDALKHVELEPELGALWASLLTLQRKLPPVTTLQRIATSAQLPLGSAKGLPPIV